MQRRSKREIRLEVADRYDFIQKLLHTTCNNEFFKIDDKKRKFIESIEDESDIDILWYIKQLRQAIKDDLYKIVECSNEFVLYSLTLQKLNKILHKRNLKRLNKQLKEDNQSTNQ